MAKQVILKTFSSARGNLTVIEEVVPFAIKRIFYIYGVDQSLRGGHRHHKTRQAAVCISGSCSIYNHDGSKSEIFVLDKPDVCLILEPFDWHTMYDFSVDAILLVFASDLFDPEDYIYEKYSV